jgi:GNAT superfamily N-acetyltransferase
MELRTFQQGDESAQVSIYNEAASHLPKFKPATLDDIRRRCRSAEFDPTTRLFALKDGQPVAYMGYHPNGRVSYPWCRKGHESVAELLLEAVLAAARQRGLTRLFCAYRSDWPAVIEFFQSHGFQKAREMVNYMLDLADMPTPAARRSSAVSAFPEKEVPSLLKIAPEVFGGLAAADLEHYLFQNPNFPPTALFALHDRTQGTLAAVGILVTDPAYADVRQVDAHMPCFRLGAFGTEGMQTKRINGLFSFVARAADCNRLGLDLMSHAAYLLRKTTVESLAAQAASDVPHLARFYDHHFRKQGSFPVLELRA